MGSHLTMKGNEEMREAFRAKDSFIYGYGGRGKRNEQIKGL
jgi:hypothetical protein